MRWRSEGEAKHWSMRALFIAVAPISYYGHGRSPLFFLLFGTNCSLFRRNETELPHYSEATVRLQHVTFDIDSNVVMVTTLFPSWLGEFMVMDQDCCP